MSKLNNHLGAALLAAILAGATALPAGDLTAFGLVKEGNKNVGEQAKDKVVQIRSDKSVASVTPNIWYVVYFDDFAKLKATEVKFAGGKVVSVKQPFRLGAAITEKDMPFDHKKLKVDSDEALKIALKENILENLTITASQMKLERHNEIPVWKLTLWAKRLKPSKKDAEIGEIWLTAEEGKVVKLDINPSKVD